MKARCDSCGKPEAKTIQLAGFKLTAKVEGREFAIVARLCERGCADQMRLYRAAHRTTEPPEIKTMWGGQKLEPLRTGAEVKA